MRIHRADRACTTVGYSNIIYSLPASGEFCQLLVILANSLDPHQARQNVGPDLDPKCFALLCYSRKNILKKVMLKNICRRSKQIVKITQQAKSFDEGYNSIRDAQKTAICSFLGITNISAIVYNKFTSAKCFPISCLVT